MPRHGRTPRKSRQRRKREAAEVMRRTMTAQDRRVKDHKPTPPQGEPTWPK